MNEEPVNDWKPVQYIHGDLVDGITRPNIEYFYWLGAKPFRIEIFMEEIE